MKKSQLSESQIEAILKQGEAGVSRRAYFARLRWPRLIGQNFGFDK